MKLIILNNADIRLDDGVTRTVYADLHQSEGIQQLCQDSHTQGDKVKLRNNGIEREAAIHGLSASGGVVFRLED